MGWILGNEWTKNPYECGRGFFFKGHNSLVWSLETMKKAARIAKNRKRSQRIPTEASNGTLKVTSKVMSSYAAARGKQRVSCQLLTADCSIIFISMFCNELRISFEFGAFFNASSAVTSQSRPFKVKRTVLTL